ncbi:hypothetical protein [Intrasporangium sp.]|uniref:hypothetical protein n=1 Tax=Intrasporangium sp. TaxID=1925024 RepID=UPI00293A33BA|nr:hypothetical protein [Intrasporangium sp.]MDV3222646.1 hypothetical protein [Intrasporangium sp.]
MSDRSQRGGSGRRRGLPAPRSESLGAEELREHVRRSIEQASGRPRPAEVVVTGTLSHAEVETHPLVLTEDGGVIWELVLPPGWSVDAAPGARVTVRGDPVEEASTTQVGPRLCVRSLSSAD